MWLDIDASLRLRFSRRRTFGDRDWRPECTSATALHSKRFFVPAFYGGCHGAPSGAPVLVPGYANPWHPPPLIGVNGGGSLTQSKEATMSNPSQFVRSALISAVDSAQLGASCIHDLGTLFQLIRESSDKHTVAYELSGIAGYLAENWAGMLEDAARDAQEKLDDVK
jgi:hypothetical protein